MPRSYSGAPLKVIDVIFCPHTRLILGAPFELRWRNYAARLSFDCDKMEAGLHPEIEIKARRDGPPVPIAAALPRLRVLPASQSDARTL